MIIMKQFLLYATLLVPIMTNAQQFSNKAMIGSARQSLERNLGKSYNNLSVVDDIGQMVVVSSPIGGTAYVDKKANRVLGVTPLSYSKDEAVPCGLQLWIEAANNAIENGITQKVTYQSSYDTDISPFVTTVWNQGKPYNNMCPKAGLKRCLTGCVATAMAQVMNYFEYPVSGHGSSTYSVTSGSSTNTKTQTYTGKINGIYDWANMIDNYSQGFTDAQATAVSTLMRDCGYSVHMNYSKESSGAYDIYIPSALSYDFDYDSLSINILSRDFCSDEKWYDIIYSEIAAKRPVLFAGASASDNDGHEFVLDGMTADGKVHINWGWGGIGDGFFDLSVMSSTNDYTLEQSIIYGFNPQPTPDGSSVTYESQIQVSSPVLTTANGQLYFKGYVNNGDWREFVGDIVMSVKDINDEENKYELSFLQAPSDDSHDALPGGYGWNFVEDDLLDFNSYFVEEKQTTEFVFPVSTYEVSFWYKSINDAAEKTAVTEGGIEWKQQFTVAADGTITIGKSTGISNVTTDTPSATNDAKVYNLNGNRVSNSYKGLKIVKGKKYVGQHFKA